MPSLLMRGAFQGARYVAPGPYAGEASWTPSRRDARRMTLGEAAALQAEIVACEGVAVALIPESADDRARAELREAEAW